MCMCMSAWVPVVCGNRWNTREKATWTSPMCVSVVNQELPAWNETGRKLMFLLKVTDDWQLRDVTSQLGIGCSVMQEIMSALVVLGSLFPLCSLLLGRQTQKNTTDVASQLFERRAAKGDDFLLTGGTGDQTWFHHINHEAKNSFGSYLNHGTAGSCRWSSNVKV